MVLTVTASASQPVRRIFPARSGAVLLAAVLLLLAGGAGTGTARADYGDRILDTATGATLGLGQILPDLKGASLIFLGEQHNDNRHRDLQLRVLRTLYNLDIPIVVGLEMFPSRDQDRLDQWIGGTLSEHSFITAHERNWGDTWDLYREIYLYAREKGIPLLGLNVPEEITTQVADRGFSSLTAGQRAEIPLVSCDIDEGYMAFIRSALSVHGEPAGDRAFERFCEAQLVWDATMAFRLVRHAEKNPGVTVVVIAGNSHSWRPGIPAQLSRFARGIDYRIILPEVPPVQTRRSANSRITDYLWLLE